MIDIKFSIIVPIYNVEKYLRTCIESILNQSYKKYEIILINDGSSDNSDMICEEYKKYNNIKYINKKNEGVSVARNIGIENANGEWLVFVDPDDWLEKTYLEEINNNIRDDIDIILFDDFVEFNNKTIENNIYFKEKKFKGKEKDDLMLQFFSKNNCKYFPQYHDCSSPWGKAYRRKFILNENLFFEPELRRAQDKIFNLNAFQMANSLLYFRKSLYHYRMNENSTWGKYSPNIIDDLKKLYKYMSIFVSKYKNDNNLFTKSYNEKVALSVNSIFRQYFYHKDCKIKTYKKRKMIKAFLNEEPFYNAVKNTQYKDISFQEKVFLFCLKNKMYSICGFLIKLRKVFLCGR